VANVSAAPEIAKVAGPVPARPPAALARADAPALARRVAARLRDAGLARAGWTIGRTGRPGIAGIALLLASATFYLSTHLGVAREVEALRAEVAAARAGPRLPDPERIPPPATALRALPARADVPAILRQLFEKAAQARLAIDSGKYDVKETKGSGVVRYQIAFPVTGSYPQIRSFLDATLSTLPAIAVSELALARRSISDANVEAQIRLTAYAAEAGAGGTARAGAAAGASGREPRPRDLEARAAERVVAPTHAAALFAQHSWVVLAPAPLPPPPPPPPEPTAPPLPYAFLGSFTPDGEPAVYFLARGDRVIDVHVGDRVDGVYRLESAAGGQLVFVYLPLDVRQTLTAGAPK
jgi:hypothetical protein